MNVLFNVISMIGIVAFSLSGAMVAVDREADLFGVPFLAVITTFGGGLIRDFCLDNTPPYLFTARVEVCVSVAVSLLVFFAARIFKKKYLDHETIVSRINNVFDAIGLGAFAVTGTNLSISLGFDAPFIAISMGLITCIGGGMLRDLILGDIPFVLCKHIYALAVLAGATLYYVLNVLSPVPESVAVIAGVLATFSLRIFATVFRWNLPKAIRFSDPSEKK